MIIFVHTQPMMLWFVLPLALVVIVWAMVTAAWGKLLQENIRHMLAVLLVAAVGIMGAVISVNINQILALQLSLIVTLFLIFGFRFCILIGAAALVITQWFLKAPWENFGFHFLTIVLAPALVALGVSYCIRKLQVRIVLVYTLGAGFLGGILGMISVGLASVALLGILESTLYWPAKDNLYLFFLLAFPAGFCNGMIVSSLAIVRPDLLKTFDDEFYFS